MAASRFGGALLAAGFVTGYRGYALRSSARRSGPTRDPARCARSDERRRKPPVSGGPYNAYMSDRKSATKRAAEATTPLEIDDGGALTAGVRELRDHLSRYLDEVKAGRSVTVTDHGTVIATIVPCASPERTMQLYREGRVGAPTLPKRPVDDFKRVHVEGGIEDILRESGAGAHVLRRGRDGEAALAEDGSTTAGSLGGGVRRSRLPPSSGTRSCEAQCRAPARERPASPGTTTRRPGSSSSGWGHAGGDPPRRPAGASRRITGRSPCPHRARCHPSRLRPQPPRPGEDVAFVTFDRRLREAALAEGLTVMPEVA